MSRDRVEFTLPNRYFGPPDTKTGMSKATCREVLRRAFGLEQEQCTNLMCRFPEGFRIRCRPSQFARFIVHRYEMGECINGIRDLEPRLVRPLDRDFYGVIAEETYMARGTVVKILEAVGVANEFPCGYQDADLVDVSKNDAS